MAYFQRISSLAQALLAVVVSLVLSFGSSIQSAQAVEYAQQYSCPIEHALVLTMPGIESEMVVNDTLMTTAVLTNNSNYVLGGVSIGIGLFEVGELYPKYWTVLSEQKQLFPYGSVSVPVEVDFKSAAIGTYELRTVAVQGGESAVLGSLIHEYSQKLSGVTIQKQVGASNAPKVSLEIRDAETGTLADDGLFTVKGIVENADTVPLIDSEIVMVVAEGVVPLGAAVFAEKKAAVTLTPKGSQSMFVRNVHGNGGVYSVFAGLVTEGVLQPIVQSEVLVPGTHEEGWSYVSYTGLSQYPVDSETEIVACVDVIGQESGSSNFREELGLTFSLYTQDRKLSETTIYSGDVDTYGYISTTAGVDGSNILLTAELLQMRYANAVSLEEEVDVIEMIRNQLIPVQKVTQAFVCASGEACKNTFIQSDVVGDTTYGKEPFWFYAGIVIAAALLMYIMLLRLPGKEVGDTTSSKELRTDELQ